MEVGLLEWFNEEKGFGLLKTPDNNEVFFHISNWKDSIEFESSNQLPIVFKVGFQRNKNTALDCKFFNPNNNRHWEKLFSLKDFSYGISINYTQKDLVELVLSNLRANFDYSVIKSFFKTIIDQIAEENIAERDEFIFRLYRNSNNENLKKILFNLIATKINGLTDAEIIRFWKKKIIPEFVPNQSVLTKNHQEIGVSELNRLNDLETKNVIILGKSNKLLSEYSCDDYMNFQEFFVLIESEKLKEKIARDLNGLANSHYWNDVTEQIINLTQNPDTTYIDIKGFIQNQPTFLDNDFLEKLTSNLIILTTQNCSFKTITDCWQNNLIELSIDSVNQKIESQEKEALIYFLNCEKCDENFAKPILDKFLNDQEYETLLKEARKFSTAFYNKYDGLVFENILQEEYFPFWENGIGKVTPFDFLTTYLDFQKEKYSRLKQWIETNLIASDDVNSLLLNNLKHSDSINDRYDFYRVFNSVEFLIKNEPDYLKLIQEVKNDFISLILWHFKEKEEFDFETLKGKFIYFKPEDQVYIFKRLFYLNHIGQVQFDLKKLDEIVRADLDLHLTNESLNDDFVLDISTHIIIECLKSYVTSKSFVFESDLILKDLQKNSKRKFKINKYFDLCEGRLTADWNWRTEGKISQVFYQNDSFYYAIEFEPGKEVEARNYYGSYTYFEKNPNFEHLKEQVKKLPRRKWNSEKNHWGVPSQYKNEVYAFAKENRFFIELQNKKHYDNNIHLVEFTRKIRDGRSITEERNIPNGITFCEGRKANKEHSKFKKEFWWCANQECFQNCVSDHLNNNINDTEKDIWEQYTLLDFLKILNINVDEYSGIDVIKDGHYYMFLGHINAFNRLLERLYCEECENLLYPVNTSHFALYRDVRFHCIDENCSMHHKEIYLNHCLYGECKTIIDSRVSKRCEHGFFICSNCGTCCSEEFFKRRLSSLKKVGGYIHPELIRNVENRNGHLEKKEYYCYKCSDMMTEISKDKYKCNTCNVTYDLEKFKWLDRKWTETHRRRKDYPTSNRTMGNDDDEMSYPF